MFGGGLSTFQRRRVETGGIGLPLSRWSRAGAAPLAPYEIESTVGWWSATDIEGPRQYLYAGRAAFGSRSGTPFQVAMLLDQAAWDGAALPDVLGSDIINDPTFATFTGFGSGGWANVGGKAVRSTGTASLANITKANCLTIGKTYLFRIPVEAIGTANLRIFAGSSGTMVQIPTTTAPNTTVEVVLKCAGSTAFIIQSTAANGTCTIGGVTGYEVPGNPAVQATLANCPLWYAGGYVNHADGTDVLTVTLPSDPGTSTLVYSTIDDVTITEDVEPGTSYSLPKVNFFDVALFAGTLTDAEKAGLTRFLLVRRDASLRSALSMWGDSYGGGSGVASQYLDWTYLLQGKFDPPRPRFVGANGGNTMAQTLTAMQADTYYRDALNIIWDKANTDETVADWKANLIAALATRTSNRFVIPSPCNATGEGSDNASYYAKVIELNDWLAETYPNNYLDLRSYLIADGLADAGITPTSDDLADIALDTIPRSLLNADGIHLNNAAQALVAPKVAEFITGKGW